MAESKYDHATIAEAEAAMDRAVAGLVDVFSSQNHQVSTSRWHHRQYIPVRLDNGSIDFILDPFIAEAERIVAEALGEPVPED